jgi:hypothetical protein
VDVFSYTLLYNPNSSGEVGYHVAVTSYNSCLLQYAR